MAVAVGAAQAATAIMKGCGEQQQADYGGVACDRACDLINKILLV